jgi:hypothetical protein
MRKSGVLRFVWGLCFFAGIARVAAGEVVTNVWAKSGGGNWGEEGAWSQGQVPAQSHWVGLLNAGPKTIEITAATARYFPGSLSMAHLIVSNANTLLLNHVGTSLKVDSGTNQWNGLEVSRGAALLDLGSDISVKGLLRVDGGEFSQDGGLVEASNTTYIHGGGVYRLTNGLFKGWIVDLPSYGTFDQEGGAANIGGTLRLTFSSYHLNQGELVASNGLSIGDSSHFIQNGGTNHTLEVVTGPTSGPSEYVQNGGLLCASNVLVAAGLASSSFAQNAGTQVVTNTLRLSGSARYYPPQPILAKYSLGSNGVLSARSLLIDQGYGFCAFESSGNATIVEDVQVIGSPDYPGTFAIHDGVFSCANFLNNGGFIDISQTGGALVVSSQFSFGGYYPGVYNGINARPARYQFTEGTLRADQIDLSAELVIASSTRAGRIVNTGQFRMAGTLRVGDASEHLGRFLLASTATINLGDGNAKLDFMQSSSEAWNAQAMLVVTNWDGLSAGGGNDQLRFGTNRGGLAAIQLRQVLFMDPAGFAPGQYQARILDSGEIVPAPLKELNVDIVGTRLALSWSTGVALQSSTNVEGPYATVEAAVSPYGTDVTVGPRLFFRLRH